MSIETILGFRNIDSTEHLNARLSGLVPKGIVKGGIIIPEPSSLQIRIKGNAADGVVFLAFGKDGMMVRERAEEHVLPVIAGITNVVVLRSKYLESQAPIAQLEVLTLGAYTSDPDKDSLIRFASVTPPAGATAVLPEHINASFRDSIEGFRRGIVRGVVDTRLDLPATSGFPATAEINFVSNNFVSGASISIKTDATDLTFPLVAPISFQIGDPSVPGLSRVNLSQKSIINAVQDLSGQVTVTTSTPHGFAVGQTVRISDNSAPQANRIWEIEATPSSTSFKFTATLTVPWTGSGGSVVDTLTPATITATTSPGVTHSLIPGQQFIITGSTEQSFNGLFTVQTVVNAQKILFQQVGYPTRDSGNGKLTKVGYALPPNAVEIGESADITAENFEQALRASALEGDLKAFAMGSSLQLEARISGALGNSFILSKDEPNASTPAIVVSSFAGGVDPNAAAAQATSESLQKGDLYVVLFGELGTIELWGFDGNIFRNLTSASAATLLDFHRRNLFINEKHLAENEKAALVGTVGIPSAINRYVTEQDTSVLTETLAAALQGADSVPPGQTNRYLTEARTRGQRGICSIPSGQNYVELPLGETWVVGKGPVISFDASAVDIANSRISFAGHSLVDGTKVKLETLSALPGGLLLTQPYFIVNATTDTFQFSSTEGGSPILFSSSGTGVVQVADDTYAKQFFNVIYSDSLLDSGGCTEYSQQDFAPVKVEGVYVDEALTTKLNPSLYVGASGTFPRADAVLLGLPLQLFVKLTSVPNNGAASLLYSQAVIERNRSPQADMLMGPQRITPAEVQDVINRTQELRFHAGIAASGKSISFPANLFRSENLQGFAFRRFVGLRPVDLTDAFAINFQTGVGTTGIVESFTPATFAGQLGKWTRYALFLTPTDKIRVVHVEEILETPSIQGAYNVSRETLGAPSLPMTDGSYCFASVAVKSSGTGTTIDDLTASCLEMYPYQPSRDAGADIVCGDGTSSYGHFTGTDALQRAYAWARGGDRIRLLPGTYLGALTIEKDDLTIDTTSGAVLSNPSGTILTVNASRFRLMAPRFHDCAVAIAIQPGAEGLQVEKPEFSSVEVKFKAPPRISVTSPNLNVSSSTFLVSAHGLLDNARVKLTTTAVLPAGLSLSATYYVVQATTNTFKLSLTKGGTPVVFTDVGIGTHTVSNGEVVDAQIEQTAVAKWTVTDGSNSAWMGDFNSPDGLQQAHDAASEGDTIFVYPGSYNRAVWTKNRLEVKGFGGSKVVLDGGGSTQTALTVEGSYNQFDNFLIQNAGTGIACVDDAKYNTFGGNVQFAASVQTAIKFPLTYSAKHYNFHPLVSGRVITGQDSVPNNPVVTVGDGEVSWGDYVGSDAINLALSLESAGTVIQVFRGEYEALQCGRDGLSVVGAPGQQTVIRADALLTSQCVNIEGSRNSFKNLFIQADNNDSDAIGLTTVGIKVNGNDNFFENIDFPVTGSERIETHLKYRVVSGARNRFMPHIGAPTGEISWTVGDGVRSFGDFNGSQGISAAIQALPSHPRSLKGVLLDPLGDPVDVQTWPGLISGASGPTCTFTGPKRLTFVSITQGTLASGSTVTIPAHGLNENEPVTFITTGFLPTPLVASPLGPLFTRYFIVNVTANTFQVATSSGGSPLYFTNLGTGSHTLISGLPFNFTEDDIHRNINISSATNSNNIGSFLITEVLDRSSVTLTRLDGLTFTNDSNLVYDFVSGAKITVMPGVYDPFIIPASRNDIEITAWGSGSDTIIQGSDGETPVSPIIRIDGNRCLVQGFRFAGGVPDTGVAIQVNGTYNTFIGNRFETANRYSFGAKAVGNRVFDAPEAEGRTAYTVAAYPSRADFVGTTGEAIQAAIDAAAKDFHLGTVYLGKGLWTLTEPLSVPPNVFVLGSGYSTQLIGDGTFPAFILDTGGGQAFRALRLQDFTFLATGDGGPVGNVFIAENWLTDVGLDPSVTGDIRVSGETNLTGDVYVTGDSLFTGDLEVQGNIGIKTDPSPAELDIKGRMILGDQWIDSNFSNALNTASVTGVNAYRTLNVIDSAATLKLASNASSSRASLEMLTWSSNSNSGYWSLYNQGQRLAIQDHKGDRIRLYIHENGNVLLGSTSNSPDSAATEVATVGSSYLFQVKGNAYTLGNSLVTGSHTVNTANLLTSSSTANIFNTSSTVSLGSSASSASVMNLATGATISGQTKTVNIGTNGLLGSTTNINIGSANTIAGTTTVNNSLVVRGDFTVQGTTATINATNMDVLDANIRLNKGGTNASAIGAGVSVEGTGATTLANIFYDGLLASNFKLGPSGSESEILTTATAQTITAAKNFLSPTLMNVWSAVPALKIIQDGPGPALLVQDEDPDITPFVIDADGKVGIQTTTTSAALSVNGKLLVGNSILTTGLSNAVNFSSTSGRTAYRPINLVDSSATVKIIRTDASNGPAFELQQWDQNITSLVGYWDVYTEGGNFGIRDRTSTPDRNRLFIDNQGCILIGAASGNAASSASEINSAYILNVKGSTLITSDLKVDGNIQDSTFNSGTISSLENLTLEGATATYSSGSITLGQNAVLQRIVSTGGTPVSISTIAGTTARAVVILVNETNDNHTFLHDTGANTSERIYTPNGLTFTLKSKASVQLCYSDTFQRWMILSGNGAQAVVPYRSVSSSYILTENDYFVSASGSSPLTFTLPTAVGRIGCIYKVKSRLSTGVTLTVTTTSNQTIDDVPTTTLARNEAISLVSNGSNWEIF